jgi:hypothetical protein
MPVLARNMVRVLARQLITADGNILFGCLLSAEPISYRNFVITIVTKTPVQSAIAFPKNEPSWVEGSEQRSEHDRREHDSEADKTQGMRAQERLRLPAWLQEDTVFLSQNRPSRLYGIVAQKASSTPTSMIMRSSSAWAAFCCAVRSDVSLRIRASRFSWESSWPT